MPWLTVDTLTSKYALGREPTMLETVTFIADTTAGGAHSKNCLTSLGSQSATYCSMSLRLRSVCDGKGRMAQESP